MSNNKIYGTVFNNNNISREDNYEMESLVNLKQGYRVNMGWGENFAKKIVY